MGKSFAVSGLYDVPWNKRNEEFSPISIDVHQAMSSLKVSFHLQNPG